MRWNSLFAVAIFLFGIGAVSAAFSQPNAPYTAIKTLALNPGGYLGKTMTLEGVIRAMGPGESWFILEDDTGRVLVTTTQIGTDLFCEPGARAVVDGKLEFLGEEHGLYFSMDELSSCSLPTQPAAYAFSRALRFVRSIF